MCDVDPNATLVEIRNMVANLTSGWPNTNQMALEGRHLAESLSDFDEWLTNGGFLPDEWRSGR